MQLLYIYINQPVCLVMLLIFIFLKKLLLLMLQLILSNILSIFFVICFLYYLMGENPKFIHLTAFFSDFIRFFLNLCHNIQFFFINNNLDIHFFKIVLKVLILAANISFDISDASFSEFSLYSYFVLEYENSLNYRKFVYSIFIKKIAIFIKKLSISYTPGIFKICYNFLLNITFVDFFLGISGVSLCYYLYLSYGDFN